MKIIVFIFILFFATQLSAQEAIHNFGNLKIHQDGAIGFHHDFINNGISDDNFGTAGFFSNSSINILGAFRPVFNDMEIMVANDLFLEVGVRVKNNTNYILGDVVTPRNYIDITLDYLDNAFYTGDDNLRKIDGFSSLTNKQEFTFPIGDDDRLRDLKISSLEIIPNARSAYFYENPNNPVSIASNFNVSEKADDVKSISTFEFWHLDGSMPSWIELKWDAYSNLSEYVDEIENLTIVGWHTENQKWQSLGAIDTSGDMTSGKIRSEVFLPDNYSVVTFGSALKRVVITLGNYILTPNGDGRNDVLEFEATTRSPNNKLSIFNRWGRLVYAIEDYQNTFEGKANVGMVVEQKKNLPDGVYFYIINLKDINLEYQGYLYLIE